MVTPQCDVGLEKRLAELEMENMVLKSQLEQYTIEQAATPLNGNGLEIIRNAGVNNEAVARYSRQLLLPELCSAGQAALLDSKVLIIGAGALGSPAIMYLAAAGIGKIGVVDGDEVETSNLHRQTIHAGTNGSGPKIGWNKAKSAADTVRGLNPDIECKAYPEFLNTENAKAIFDGYDVVLDCSDNVDTRYLINDACVLNKKPLVSGSALRQEGQMTIYNYNGGPCYRCLFPQPPPAEVVTSCSEGGVLGMITGMVGLQQATETVRICLARAKKIQSQSVKYTPYMYLSEISLNPESPGIDIRRVQLRQRKANCAICGPKPRIFNLNTTNYNSPCPYETIDYHFDHQERMEASEFVRFVSTPHILLDVRPEAETEICAIKNAIRIPYLDLPKQIDRVFEATNHLLSPKHIVVLCRRGNDSRLAVEALLAELENRGSEDSCKFNICDIIGGYEALAKQVGAAMPRY